MFIYFRMDADSGPPSSPFDLLTRITINPKQCGGKPCVRGMRVRVSDVLELLAGGMTSAEVVEDLDDLELEDVRACLFYAARPLNNSESGA